MAIAKPRVRRLVVLSDKAVNPVIIDLGEQIEQIDVLDTLKSITMMEQADNQLKNEMEEEIAVTNIEKRDNQFKGKMGKEDIRYVRVQGPYFGYHCQWAESTDKKVYVFLISDNPSIFYQNILDYLVDKLAASNEEKLTKYLHESLNKVYLYIVLNEMPFDLFNNQQLLSKYVKDVFIGFRNLNTGKETFLELIVQIFKENRSIMEVKDELINNLLDEPKKLKQLFTDFNMIDKSTLFHLIAEGIQNNTLIALTTKPIKDSKKIKSIIW